MGKSAICYDDYKSQKAQNKKEEEMNIKGTLTGRHTSQSTNRKFR